MSYGWFSTLGWWDQISAYNDFDTYRSNKVNGNLNTAIESALPIIRVVFSTNKIRVNSGDEDDLISSAALTIAKAIPKMATKPVEKLDNDKKYMRYLFTCVINAFLRELDVLHGKQNKVKNKIQEKKVEDHGSSKVSALETSMVLRRLPDILLQMACERIRFIEGDKRNVCEYVLKQLIYNREIAKSVLNMFHCVDKDFYTRYCSQLLVTTFKDIQAKGAENGALFFELEDVPFEGNFCNEDVYNDSLLDGCEAEYDCV